LTAPEDWASKLMDRLPNSPAADRLFFVPCPIQIDGRPHTIGQRITEVCALVGRAAKRGEDLGVFIPGPDEIDKLTMVLYLHLVRAAVVSGRSAPGRWATAQTLHARGDLWLLGNVSRLRTTILGRLALDNSAITRKLRCRWYASKGGQGRLEGVGGPELPSLCLFGADAVMQGSLASVLEGEAAPYAVVVDSSLNEGRDLAHLVRRLRHLSQGAPILVLGTLGDKAAILEARRAKIPVWVLRAGDAARLSQLHAEGSSILPSMDAARPGGSDLASSRLIARICVELGVLEAPAARRLLSPLLVAVERLEHLVTDERELVSRARSLVRAVLALSVPWKLHADAITASTGVGRFATLSLEGRLQALRESETTTGDTSVALQQLISETERVFEVLRAPSCVTAKQAALLEAAATAQGTRRPLWIVCANETGLRSVQTYLGDHDINVVSGYVRVLTRPQVRREVADGIPMRAFDLLLLRHYLAGPDACVRPGAREH
jgi:hypothetical protein